MNLASRCREALSHVAMLKRELAAHQRRSAEALAMQRQNAEARAIAAAVAQPATPTSNAASTATTTDPVLTTPKTNRTLEVATSSTPNTGRSTPPLPLTSPVAADSPLAVPPKLTPRRAMDVAKELEILDETVASHALKAKAAASTPTAVDKPESPHPSLSEPVDSDDFEEEEEALSAMTNQMHPPQSVDDVPGHRPPSIQSDSSAFDDNNANSSSLNSDTTPGGLGSPSKTYFPHSASPKVDHYNEEYPSDFSAVRKRAAMRPKLGMLGGFAENGEDEGSSHSLNKKSSLDAFEASFATDFPDSFSPRDTVAEEKKSEIYNPFQSPARPKPGATTRVEPDHRKDPPGKIRTSQRPAQNKSVFMALSQSPRGLDENRSPRPSLASPRQQPSPQPSPQQPSSTGSIGFRKSGFTRALNPPPLDIKQTETGRSRYDRLAQQQQRKGAAPFDEPRNEEEQARPASPRQQDKEPEEQTTPVSVKDRASLFKGGGPRSPEKESLRLNSLNSRFTYERTFVDEGDIPMISSIGRSKASPPRQESNPAAVVSTTPTSTGNNSYGTSTARSPSYTTSNFTRSSRVLPWEDDQKDEMEQRRGARQPVLYSESKLRRGGDLYSSYGKEEKSERE